MKDYIVLEVNGKKETLGCFTIETPKEYLFADDTDYIVNHRIFDEFTDGIFWLTVNELVYEVDKKINNVFINFLNHNEELVCSIVIDKLKPKRRTYRVKVIDWEASGYTFKYTEDVLE